MPVSSMHVGLCEVHGKTFSIAFVRLLKQVDLI